MTAPRVSTLATAAAGYGEALKARVRGLAGGGGHERSVKLVPGRVLADRFLLTFHKTAFGPDPAVALGALAAALHMPSPFMAELATLLPRADLVHVGYEAGEGGPVYKLYLEFAADFRAGLERADRERTSLLLHHAFKWNPEHAERRAVTRYLSPPCRTADEIRVCMREAGAGGGTVLAVAEALLDRALARADADDLLLMDVEEPGNPRRSFDLNLYPAGLTIASLAADLAPAWREFGVGGDVARTMAAIGEHTLGHVSAGLGRDAKPFLTLYYGVEGW